jgi:hypothetical protein
MEKVRGPVAVNEEHAIPPVIIVVLVMVALGIIIPILIPGMMVLWPFVFATSVMLLVNDASDRSGAGVPPFQAYGLFFGTFIVFFVFVALVSTINLWLLGILLIVGAYYVVRDWKRRKQREAEVIRRRMAGVCVRCLEPVSNEVDAICGNCMLPVHSERLNLLRLGRAIANNARSQHSRQVLSGKTPNKAQAKLNSLQQQRAYRYKKK